MEKKYYLRGLGLGIIVTAVIMGIALSGGAVRREMTDEEVIARARELGMTEDTRLLEPADENQGQKQEEETPAEAKEPVKKDVAVKAEAEAQKKDAETAAEAEAQKKDAETAAEAEAQKKDVETAAAAGAQKKDENAEAETETKPSTDTPEPKKDTNEMTKQDDDGNTKPSGTETNSDTKPVSGGTKSVTIVSGDSSYTIAKKLEAAGVVDSASSYDTYLCEHGYDKKLRTGTFRIPEGATEEQIAKIVTGQ